MIKLHSAEYDKTDPHRDMDGESTEMVAGESAIHDDNLTNLKSKIGTE